GAVEKMHIGPYARPCCKDGWPIIPCVARFGHLIVPAGRSHRRIASNQGTLTSAGLIQSVINFANFKGVARTEGHGWYEIPRVVRVCDRVASVRPNPSEGYAARAANVASSSKGVAHPLIRCPINPGNGDSCSGAISSCRSCEKCVRLVYIPRVSSISAAPRLERKEIPPVSKREDGVVPVTADIIIVKEHPARTRATYEIGEVCSSVCVVVNIHRPATTDSSPAFRSVVGDVAVMNYVIPYHEPGPSQGVRHEFHISGAGVYKVVVLEEQKV